MTDAEQRHSSGSGVPADAAALIAAIARNQVQLYNQLQDQGRHGGELRLIRSAYDLTAQLYAGAYQADGKPFVLHVVAVASTLALLELPGELVAAALLHNVYNNADFGDGRKRRISPRRQAMVRAAVGEEVEGLVRRFAEIRLERRLDELIGAAADMPEPDRHLVTMDLADVLEKYLDGGVLYFGDGKWVTAFADRRLPDLIALARALGHPVLGEALRLVVERAGARRVDPALLTGSTQRYLRFVLPLSARRSVPVLVRRSAGWRWLAGLRGRWQRRKLT